MAEDFSQRPDDPDFPPETPHDGDQALSQALPAPELPVLRPHLALIVLIVALVVLAGGLLLNNLGLLPEPVLLWWPLVIVIPAALAALVALVRQRPRALLASTAALGVGLSLFLAAQNVAPPGTTLVGFVFISAGAGLLLRGLLFGGRPA